MKPRTMPLKDSAADSFPQRYWYARTRGHQYLAVFNLEDKTSVSDLPWLVFHLTDKPHAVFDIERFVRGWSIKISGSHQSRTIDNV